MWRLWEKMTVLLVLTFINTAILIFFLIAGILAYNRYYSVMQSLENLQSNVESRVNIVGDLGSRLLSAVTKN